MKQVPMGSTMAKRLTKALRGKRRWVGLAVSPEHQTRSSLDSVLSQLGDTLDTPRPFRLMEFHSSNESIAEQSRTKMADESIETPPSCGFAIVQVPLETIKGVRALLARERSYEDIGCMSLTTSGKIRLVRERLHLPKPTRKR